MWLDRENHWDGKSKFFFTQIDPSENILINTTEVVNLIGWTGEADEVIE